MENTPAPWQDRFALTTCSAAAIDPTIPPAALGVAVIYAPAAAGEDIFLVLESRAGGLRAQCQKRLQTAKFPAGAKLLVSFQAQTLPDASPEHVHAACRQQVILAGELRRALRPAMR